MATQLTSGRPMRLIIAFALPMMLGNMFQLLYSMADMIIVGRILGVEALAGVGLTGPIGFMFMGLVIGLAQGFSIFCSQLYGAGNRPGLRRAFCASLVLGVLLSVLLAVSSLVTESALRWTNAPPEAFAPAVAYLSVTLLGGGTMAFYNIFSSSITALGDSRTPLVFLVLTCVLNIGLDFLFILGFDLGTAGAAWATVTSLGISAVLCGIHIWRHIPELRPHGNDWRYLTWPIFRRHLALGLPMGLQGAVINVGFLVLQTALNGLGASAVAACTSVARVDAIAVMPLVSIGRAVATYVGQNIGAGLPARVCQGVRDASLVAVVYAFMAAAFCIILGGPLLRVFVGDGQEVVVGLGQRLLQIQCGLYWLLALMFVLRNALQGLGKSVITTASGLLELAMRCAAALFWVVPLGFDGVCLASPLAWTGAMLLLVPAFFAWKRREILQKEP
ncbi:MAG: MATE family efflux transporter [Desulfovibrio sp.]|nr:MATE family efflux transporter [Desulfovibrio sp.]